MNLSSLIKFERKSLYPANYKHLLDAIENSSLMILDNTNGNSIVIDNQICFRFKINGEDVIYNLTPSSLYERLKQEKGISSSCVEYQYKLDGEPQDFKNIKVD